MTVSTEIASGDVISLDSSRVSPDPSVITTEYVPSSNPSIL